MAPRVESPLHGPARRDRDPDDPYEWIRMSVGAATDNTLCYASSVIIQ
jgi:hypothetical protein